MGIKENIASRMIEAGGSLSVKSALNPILWLCAIIDAPCFVLFFFMENIPFWLILLAFLPVSVALFGFIYFLICDPDKLQSEEYQLRKRSLELIQQKGDSRPQMIPENELEDFETIGDLITDETSVPTSKQLKK